MPADPQIYGSGSIDLNSPELPESGSWPKKLPKVRAIETEVQCANIIRRVLNDNRERNTKNARIQAKANADRPFDASEMTRDGLAWKSNFSTQPLPALIARVFPRLVAVANDAKYLTNSALPDTIDGASRKTDAFRREFTSVVRARPEWQDFLEEAAQENSLFGYTSAAWLDEYCWFPVHYRGDRFLVPQGTKQKSQMAQTVVFVEHYQPHELFEKIEDVEAAKNAGWVIDTTVQAINEAQPPDARSINTESERIYEDLAREANLSNSLNSAAKEVVLYSVLVTEVTGKITHWRVRASDYKKVFLREDRFDSMSDVAHFFAFERGNGTMHGSKGVGRIVYAMAGILDRSRNEVVDRLQLAGKVIVQGAESDLRRFKMSVFGNAILMGSAYNIAQQTINPHTEEFFELDSYLRSLLDELAGNVSPKHLQGERVTAKQVELYAQREEEGKDNVLSRWALQLAGLLSIMQRKMFHASCDEEDAKEARKRLLQIMSEEELDMLAGRPSAEVVKDLTDLDRQKIVLVAAEGTGNPYYDQRELQKRKVTALLGAETAEALILPVNDPTVTAEQTRMQTLENLILSLGQNVPVSPRDSHIEHLKVLEPALQALVDSMPTNSGVAENITSVLTHAKEHVQMGLASGEDQGFYTSMANKIAIVENSVKQVVAFEQTVKDLVAQGVPPDQAIQAAQSAAQGAQQSGFNSALPPAVGGPPVEVAPGAPAAPAPAQ